MTSYRLSKMAATASQIYFRFGCSYVSRFRRHKAICIPNFDQISQSTAEIFLHCEPNKTHQNVLSYLL